jgi:membrane protein implicated in regulation of membrane protease activity
LGLPKLLFLAMIGFAGWWIYRKFVEDAQKLTRKNEQKRQEDKTGAIATLIQDPKTGEYRVKRADEE